MNNRKCQAKFELFKKGEDKNAKLVLLFEGALQDSEGKIYSDKIHTIINEKEFF